jgi:hypothetical protein
MQTPSSFLACGSPLAAVWSIATQARRSEFTRTLFGEDSLTTASQLGRIVWEKSLEIGCKWTQIENGLASTIR